MTVEMLKLTGDPVVADELELSTLNSAMGLFSPSGRWSTYNTPMDGDRKANFHEIVFRLDPDHPSSTAAASMRHEVWVCCRNGH